MNTIQGYLLTEEETEACLELLKKIREEKRKIEEIQKCKNYLELAVADVIEMIGLEETKRIIRNINHNLPNK